LFYLTLFYGASPFRCWWNSPSPTPTTLPFLFSHHLQRSIILFFLPFVCDDFHHDHFYHISFCLFIVRSMQTCCYRHTVYYHDSITVTIPFPSFIFLHHTHSATAFVLPLPFPYRTTRYSQALLITTTPHSDVHYTTSFIPTYGCVTCILPSPTFYIHYVWIPTVVHFDSPFYITYVHYCSFVRVLPVLPTYACTFLPLFIFISIAICYRYDVYVTPYRYHYHFVR